MNEKKEAKLKLYENQSNEEIGFDVPNAFREHGGEFVKAVYEKGQKDAVIHARWEYVPNANDWGIGGWCCSMCGYKNDAIGISEKLTFPISMIAGTNYCANCGARMDGKL